MIRLLLTGASGFIGTNLVEHFKQKDCSLLNLDIHPPLNSEHGPFWQQVDIMQPAELQQAFEQFAPTHVIHMAARADCDENTSVEEGYAVNTVGTENVLNVMNRLKSIDRSIIVSTQYVCGPGRLPEHDQDFFPVTVYGQSKVVTEQLTRRAGLGHCWTLVRPTNVWGPWHYRYAREAWNVIRKGFYLHPGGAPVVRSYGYVENVVWQLEQILLAHPKRVNQCVYYLGDKPIDIYDWSNAFSLAITKRKVIKVPRIVLRLIGCLGDGFASLGREFPLTTSRFHSMTSRYLTPMDKTFEMFGEPPCSLDDGVQRTVEWLYQEAWR